MKNGRENRNNGNQEKGKKEKETLSRLVRSQQGTRNASPKFFRVKETLGDKFNSVVEIPCIALAGPAAHGILRFAQDDNLHRTDDNLSE